MFNRDFYPTPPAVIDQMTEGLHLEGATVLEPSAGKGNIVQYLLNMGAEVIACEKDPELKKILQTKCKVIADDFLTVTSDQVSHIRYIVMNPPFSADEQHINHAWEIAPPGCKIVALCNSATLENVYSAGRKKLEKIIEESGTTQDMGDCFSDSERKTGVNVTMIRLDKPGGGYEQEFEGFFTDEEEEAQENGIMSYNVIRDLVNRYVGAVKIYDKQLSAAIELNSLLSSFYGTGIGFQCTEKGAPKARADFKKDLQKAGWNWIFEKMNLQKYATRGLKADINKFVEQQQNIPFTMKNIYRMLDIVIGTASQRMDKAIEEVFEKVTKHCEDNKYGLPGWKTNSHYLLTKKFILDGLTSHSWTRGWEIIHYSERYELIDDLHKALCYITGEDYDEIGSIWGINFRYEKDEKGNDTKKRIYNEYNSWIDFGMFRLKGFKKGTLHMEFKDEEVWAKFNQRVAKIKGYPLFEAKQQTAYQNRQTGRAQQGKASGWKGGAAQPKGEPKQATILFSAKIA